MLQYVRYTLNLYSYTSKTVVRIGFEEMLYFVDESAGEITVSVGVLSGTLSGDVMVQVNTNDNSAAGK